jgi:hypothetical protein
MLVTDDRPVRDGDVYILRGSLDRLSVPETLHALVAARLDGLTRRIARSSRTRPSSA